MKTQKNIKDSMEIFLIALFFVIITIGVASYTKKMLVDSVNQNRENMKEITLQISNNIESKIDNYINELSFISSKVKLDDENNIKLDDENNIQIDKDVFINNIQWGLFEEVLIVGPDGNGQDTSGENVFIGNEEFFRKAIKEKKTSVSYSLNYNSYKDVVLYSVPIVRNNEVKGIVIGIDSMSLLTDKLTSGIYEGKGCLYISDKSGNLLFSRHENENGNNVYDLIEIDSIHMLEEMDRDYISLKGKIHNKKSYFGFAKIANSDWYMGTAVPLDSIFLQSKDSMKIMVVLLVMAVLLCLNIIIYILKIKKANEKRVAYIAFKDSLTGLMNYDKFVLACEEYLLKHKRKNCILICFDIDKFKLINDIYGYKTGDEILKIISRNLDYYFEDDSIYGRLNGDTFGLLLEISENELKMEYIAEFIKDKIGNIQSDKNINLEINIDLSIGIYNIENEEVNVKKFIDSADMARLKSKEARYKTYIVFDENMSKEKKKIIQMERDLFLAIKNKEFSIYYQPKFNINTGKIVGCEALIRWIHPTMGMVSPNEFIPIAEKTRFINNIGQWVFDEVCKMLRQWIDEGIEVVPIAINLSRVELYQQDLIDMLKFGINKYNIEPKLIEIEITESTALNDIDFINEKLSEIKALGMNVAMDDFGTGNSNLSNLKNIQIDVLKLDRSLLLDIENNAKTELMVKSIVDLSKNLSLNTVCEGVENMSQVEILKGTGCEIVQGYVFSKPIEIEQYKTLLIRNNSCSNT